MHSTGSEDFRKDPWPTLEQPLPMWKETRVEKVMYEVTCKETLIIICVVSHFFIG
jgi:hypothetical protein